MTKSKEVVVFLVLVMAGLVASAGLLRATKSSEALPPPTPVVGATQLDIEKAWGKPAQRQSFTTEINGESITIVTAEFEAQNQRVRVEFDRRGLAKKIDVLGD